MTNMKVPEYLFFLIKSLTQAEKRYFKMNSNFQLGEGKLYIQIFDAIDKMEKYNEKDLLKYVDKKKLSVSKNFLYNKILRSLRAYNERSSVDIELYNIVAEARILMAKGLFHPTLKRLKKGKKIAIDYEKSLLLVEIIDLEIDIIGQVVKQDIKHQFKQLFDEAIETLDKYIEAIKLKRLSRELHSELILGKMRELKQEYIDKVNQLPKTADKLRSFYAKSYYHGAMGTYYWIQRDAFEHRNHLQQKAKLWKENPKINSTQNQRYRICMANYLTSSLKVEDYNSVPDTIAEIKQIKAKSMYEKASAFENTDHPELLYYMRIGRFEKAAELVPNIEKNIFMYRGLMNKASEVSFYYNIIIVYLALERYKDAAKWLNRILYDEKSEPYENIKRFAWILEVIIHHKLGSGEVVKHIFTDAKLPVNQTDSHPFEVLAFKHLKKITKTLTGRKALFKEFQKELDEFSQNNQHFGSEELSIWIESNITNMSFVEVMRKRQKASD